MKKQKWLITVICIVLCLVVMISFVIPVSAASGPTLSSTLSDNIVQKGSKKTFDVWAKNASGNKIKATVTLNGEKLSPTWDDNEKSSYTLSFSKQGENIVVISASSDGGIKKQLTYHIEYQKASPGEAIGTATWSIEMFTIGCGYLVYPVEVSIYEGETSAEQLIRLLHSNGFVGYYGGSVKSAFYLGYIANGTATGGKYNNYQKSGSPATPKQLNLSPSIPAVLVPHLQKTMTFYDPDDYAKNWNGYLGEFVFTNGSGWMYSVNNIFPNVGFADTFLSDGDTVRVQFTLGYGADIGGFGAMGTDIPNVDTQPTSGYFNTANKDALTRTIRQALASGLMTKANVKKAYSSALSVAETLNASQSQVNSADNALKNALLNPGDETNAVPNDSPSSIGGSDSHGTTPSISGNSSSSDSSKGALGSTENSNQSAAENASGADESTMDSENAVNDSALAETTDTEAESGLVATDTQSENKPKIWIWIVIIAAILILSAGCFCIYWFYFKKRVVHSKKAEEIKKESEDK